MKRAVAKTTLGLGSAAGAAAGDGHRSRRRRNDKGDMQEERRVGAMKTRRGGDGARGRCANGYDR